MTERELYKDQWTTVAVLTDRTSITWLNKAARLAVITLCFHDEHYRLAIGKVLAGPDGGVWLKHPGLAVPPSAALDVHAAALQLAVDRLRSETV